jgi:hypothetical protein
MSVLPGANYLGFGFNVYQDITMAGRTRPLFDMEAIGGQFRLGDQTYDVPENAIANPPDRPAIFDQGTYESSAEFVEDLKTEANVGATIGGFEGKASAKYDRLCQAMKNAVLCRISDIRPICDIDLKSRDSAHLTAAFKADLAALPSTYTDATRIRFLRFFHTNGMHFVKSVTMGGRLNYFYSYEKQQNETTEAVKADAEASYGGVKGGGSASWNKVNKNMFQSARKSIETMPPGSLNSVTPAFGEDLGDAYDDWVRAAREQPFVVGFRLEPISDLVADEQKHEALCDALAEFGECYISAEATSQEEWRYPGRIGVKGQPLAPEKDLPTHSGYLQFTRQVVVDRHTLAVCLNRAYGFQVNSSTRAITNVSGDMLEDVLPYNNHDHILILTTKWTPNPKSFICITRDLIGLQSGIYPKTPSQTRYFDLLRNAGASNELHSMLFNDYSYKDATAYVFVGVLGQGPAREAFVHGGGDNARSPHLIVSLEPVEQHGQLYYNPIL